MMLPIHEHFIEKVKEKFIRDDRLIGLLAGGSTITGEMDEYSDLDLIVVYRAAYREEIMNERLNIAEQPGDLLSAFTGEHVGEPRLIICLYGPPPLHIDYKFVSLEELEHRIENPLVLWERGARYSCERSRFILISILNGSRTGFGSGYIMARRSWGDANGSN